MQETPQSRRTILAILAIVVGIFMIAAAPIIIQVSMERVVQSLIEVSKTRPQYASGILLFSFSYPLYRGLIFIGGVTLLLLARPIFLGRPWAYAPSLLASAFPAAGGMFMFLPYVSWVEGFPIPMVISWVGLLFFWSMILMRRADPWLRWGQMLALTFIGMLTTHTFVVGIGNFRMLLTRPEKPLYTGLEWWILSWSAPIQWICTIMFFVAIYLLAARRPSGWWLGLVGAASILAIDAPTQVIRSLLTDTTSLDYLYGSLLSIGLLATLLFGRFRKQLLVDASEPEKSAT